MSEFARAFKVTFPDGIPGDLVIHGVQFPSGRCVLDGDRFGLTAATSFENLEIPAGAKVEWQDGGQPS